MRCLTSLLLSDHIERTTAIFAALVQPPPPRLNCKLVISFSARRTLTDLFFIIWQPLAHSALQLGFVLIPVYCWNKMVVLTNDEDQDYM